MWKEGRGEKGREGGVADGRGREVRRERAFGEGEEAQDSGGSRENGEGNKVGGRGEAGSFSTPGHRDELPLVWSKYTQLLWENPRHAE